jgi:hypothetical protein
MKKSTLTLIFLLAFAPGIIAQVANASLDINSVKALVNSNGDLFWDYTSAKFEIPKGNGTNTIFAGAMWIGGMDAGSQLHLAAQTYRQSGSDFYPGPVLNPPAYSTSYDAAWNKVWKINRSMIDSFRLGLYGSNIPAPIAGWPGNGNTSQGEPGMLADFVDINGDGVYDPSSGDYPCIKGDQAVLMIFNDDRNIHTETGGQKLGVEFHAMLYAYKAPGTWLDSVVFLNYKMYNRSATTYTNAYLGSWMDFDLGYYGDDYTGCDVGRNIFYVYNGTLNDGSSSLPSSGTYGANPPAQGVVFLRGPQADTADGIDNNRDGTIDEPGEVNLMSKFIYYKNDFTATGNPVNDIDYYRYMTGFWKDGSPVTYGGNGYGGNTPCDFMFPGDSDPIGWGIGGTPSAPSPQTPWFETATPGDRRGMASSGPFTIQPGQEMCVDLGFVYGRGNNGPISSADVMRQNADSVKAFYLGNSPCTCVINPLSVNEISNQLVVQFYPNPASDNVTVLYNPENGKATVEIYDMTGKMIATETISKASTVVDMKNFAPGIYMIRITDGKSSGAARILKQ